LADIALNAAKSAGATYTDVRIGRLPQPVCNNTRKEVQELPTLNLFGAGIR